MAAADYEKPPPMVAGTAETDREWMEEHGVEKALALALGDVVRTRPKKPLQRVAELIAPEIMKPADQRPVPPKTPPGGAAHSEDRYYLEVHKIEKTFSTHLAQIVREKPEKPLQRFAELLAPELCTTINKSAPASPSAK